MIHKPVLVKEVLEYLNPKPNENFIDGTVGQAGHTLLLLEKNGPEGKVLGIDLDAGQIENAKQTTADYANRMILVNDSYANIKSIATSQNFGPANGILLDVGYSSWQIEDSAKGFSFLKSEALDMRYSLQNPLTAQMIVNEWPETEIKKILEEYGEEKFAKQIAKEIVKQRSIKKIESTFELLDIIASAIPTPARKQGTGLSNWARAQIGARTFQALRIAVNDELGSLARALPDALSVLSSGGRLVVISFHSLEDRIVKNFFKEKENEGIVTILTKKPVMAGEDEVNSNPRARSAKLRAIINI